MNSRFTNYQVAAYALYVAGGATRRTDTEDVAAACWGLARSRFGWKKYPEFPDKDIVRTALSDGKKVKYGRLVDGTGDEGWILTPNGIDWIRSHESGLRAVLDQPTRSALTLSEDTSLKKVRSHPVFAGWKAGGGRVPRLYDIADVAQLTADAPPSMVLKSIGETENAAILAGDAEMMEFVKWLRTGIDTSKA